MPTNIETIYPRGVYEKNGVLVKQFKNGDSYEEKNISNGSFSIKSYFIDESETAFVELVVNVNNKLNTVIIKVSELGHVEAINKFPPGFVYAGDSVIKKHFKTFLKDTVEFSIANGGPPEKMVTINPGYTCYNEVMVYNLESTPQYKRMTEWPNAGLLEGIISSNSVDIRSFLDVFTQMFPTSGALLMGALTAYTGPVIRELDIYEPFAIGLVASTNLGKTEIAKALAGIHNNEENFISFSDSLDYIRTKLAEQQDRIVFIDDKKKDASSVDKDRSISKAQNILKMYSSATGLVEEGKKYGKPTYSLITMEENFTGANVINRSVLIYYPERINDKLWYLFMKTKRVWRVVVRLYIDYICKYHKEISSTIASQYIETINKSCNCENERLNNHQRQILVSTEVFYLFLKKIEFAPNDEIKKGFYESVRQAITYTEECIYAEEFDSTGYYTTRLVHSLTIDKVAKTYKRYCDEKKQRKKRKLFFYSENGREILIKCDDLIELMKTYKPFSKTDMWHEFKNNDVIVVGYNGANTAPLSGGRSKGCNERFVHFNAAEINHFAKKMMEKSSSLIFEAHEYALVEINSSYSIEVAERNKKVKKETLFVPDYD